MKLLCQLTIKQVFEIFTKCGYFCSVGQSNTQCNILTRTIFHCSTRVNGNTCPWVLQEMLLHNPMAYKNGYSSLYTYVDWKMGAYQNVATAIRRKF